MHRPARYLVRVVPAVRNGNATCRQAATRQIATCQIAVIRAVDPIRMKAAKIRWLQFDVMSSWERALPGLSPPRRWVGRAAQFQTLAETSFQEVAIGSLSCQTKCMPKLSARCPSVETSPRRSIHCAQEKIAVRHERWMPRGIKNTNDSLCC